MSSNIKKTAFVLFAVFFVAFDRFLKMLALKMEYSNPIPLIRDFFQFSFVRNYYIAFSIPLSGIFLNILIGVIVLILVFFVIKLYQKGGVIEFGALTILLFGAISNYADRLKYGFVIDYLDLRYFTVFNVADCMIVGAVFEIFLLNFIKKDIV